MVIGSFVAFLLVFVLIGAAATLKSERTGTDYLVANRNVRPWLVGLSAMATNNSRTFDDSGRFQKSALTDKNPQIRKIDRRRGFDPVLHKKTLFPGASFTSGKVLDPKPVLKFYPTFFLG